MFYFNLGRKQKIIISLLFTLLLLSIYMIMSTHVYAAEADAAKDAPNKAKAIFNAALLILKYLSYTAGVFFIFASLFKFDQHKKNPTQIPMSQPLTLFVIGAALLVLPVIVEYAGGGSKGPDTLSIPV